MTHPLIASTRPGWDGNCNDVVIAVLKHAPTTQQIAELRAEGFTELEWATGQCVPNAGIMKAANDDSSSESASWLPVIVPAVIILLVWASWETIRALLLPKVCALIGC